MTSSGVIITDTGFQNCSIYDVVAFDPQTNSYVKAQPTWVMSENTIKPSDEAYIAGIVCSVPDVTGTAQLLINGVIEFDNGKYATPGEYYLAADGEMSLGAPNGVLPVYCGYRASSGKFIFKPAAPVYAGHRHTVYELTSGTWTGSNGDWVYDSAGVDTTCAQLLASVPINTFIGLADGETLKPAVTSGGLLTYDGHQAPDSYTLYGTNPLATIEPEIRAVTPAEGNTVIRATQAYGTVYLDTVYSNTNTSGTGTAITTISGGGITTSPVVHSLTAGGGIKITGSGGQYTLYNEGVGPGALLDFQTINANNVLVGATAGGPLLTFPANIDAAATGIMRLPAAEGVWDFQVFLWVDGVGGSLNVSTYIQPPPVSGAVMKVDSGYVETVNITGSNNMITQVLGSSYTADGNSLITVTVGGSSATPTAIKAFGICLGSNTTIS